MEITTEFIKGEILRGRKGVSEKPNLHWTETHLYTRPPEKVDLYDERQDN